MSRYDKQFTLIDPDGEVAEGAFLFSPNLDTREAWGDILVPASGQSFLNAELDFEDKRYKTGASLIHEFDRSLSSAGLSLNLGTFYTPKFLFVGGITPALTSAGSTSHVEDRWDATVLGSYFFRSDFEFHLGVAALDLGDKPDIYPLVGGSAFLFRHEVHVTVTVPDEGRISYRLSNNLEPYVRATFDLDNYHVHDYGRVQAETSKVGMGCVWHVLKALNLSAEIGSLLADRVEVLHRHESLGSDIYGMVSLGIGSL